MLLPSWRWTQSPIAAAYDRTPLSKGVDRLDEPRPTGFRFLGELKSSRGSVALCGPTWVGRTHAGVRCHRMSTPRRPDAGVPQRPRPAPDAHASLLKLPPPSNYFLCGDPGAGFAPSCLGECAIAARHEPEHRTMWYRKNVRGWERAARLIGGGLMLICGVVALHASPPGLLLSSAGGRTPVTRVFGYCPACAIAGREPLKA